MSSNVRWVAVASLAANLLLLQAFSQQSGELTDLRYETASLRYETASLRDETASYSGTIARLQADNEAASVELAVFKVLERHRLRLKPATLQAVADTIISVAQRYDLAPELILAVISTESSFDPHAESEVGALGLMQLMPATAIQMASELELELKVRRLLTDPELNILLGSFYLQKLIHQFEDLNAALAAYNVGPNRLHYLMTEQGHVPRTYARKVQRVTAELREEFF
jgi:soluble lytic murein transglycosylase